jgi:hypothetical protein
MNLWDMRALFRRWYAVLLGLLLTGGLCFAAFTLVPLQYQAEANVLFLPPKTISGNGGNPYLDLGGLDGFADVAARAVSDPLVVQRLKRDGLVGEFTVVPDLTSSGPVLLVTSKTTEAPTALNSLDLVLKRLPRTAAQIQDSSSIPERAQITVKVITRSEKAEPLTKDQLRVLLVALAGGLGITVFGTSLLDGFLRARAGRRRSVEDDEHRRPVDDDEYRRSVDVDHRRPVADVDHRRPVADVDHRRPVADVDPRRSVEIDRRRPVGDIERRRPEREIERQPLAATPAPPSWPLSPDSNHVGPIHAGPMRHGPANLTKPEPPEPEPEPEPEATPRSARTPAATSADGDAVPNPVLRLRPLPAKNPPSTTTPVDGDDHDSSNGKVVDSTRPMPALRPPGTNGTNGTEGPDSNGGPRTGK